MSTVEVRKRVRESLKATRAFLVGAKKSIQEDLSKGTPKVVHSLDSSVDKAGQGLSNAISSVERRASNEQLELLKAYRSFLQQQVQFVDDQVKARERNQQASKK